MPGPWPCSTYMYIQLTRLCISNKHHWSWELTTQRISLESWVYQGPRPDISNQYSLLTLKIKKIHAFVFFFPPNVEKGSICDTFHGFHMTRKGFLRDRIHSGLGMIVNLPTISLYRLYNVITKFAIHTIILLFLSNMAFYLSRAIGSGTEFCRNACEKLSEWLFPRSYSFSRQKSHIW